MKKILVGALALLAVCAVSCKKSSEAADASDAGMLDSLSYAFGQYVGSSVGMQNSELTREQKEAFLSALRGVLMTKGDDAAVDGAALGGQLLSTIKAVSERENLNMNPEAVFRGLKETFLLDSLDYMSAMQYQQNFAAAQQRASERARERRQEELRNSPEAVQNRNAAADATNRVTRENPNAQVSETGLVYVIENPGEGEKPGANSTVKVKYTGKHLNGEQFDSSNDTPATFALRGVVPGFREGLMLLGKGGKATLYIPGSLAYGLDGQAQAGIGPDEMLVFDVELVDFN